MRVTVEFPEGVFRPPKTPEQLVRELHAAAAMYWLARGEISPERAREITAVQVPAHENLINLLLSMPEGGDDSDFDRPSDDGRPEETSDT